MQVNENVAAAILRQLRLTESIVATAAYTAVAILLMVDVVGRELFSTTFLGLQQLAVYGAIIAGFTGLTLATSENAHLRPGFMDFIAGKFEPQVQRLGDLLSAIFFVGACVVAFSFVQASINSGDKAPVMYFLLWPLQLIIPYAFASAAIKHIIFAFKPALKPAHNDTEG